MEKGRAAWIPAFAGMTLLSLSTLGEGGRG